MKLDIVKPHIESFGELDAKLFSIGDQSFVFDILRSKMYSNPILAICREYASNARDSVREAGNPNEPIQIYLPNSMEPYYKIKDFGVGISTDRMENIFIRYGISSKREDNTQTGAFGLGSKVGFSYTDSFSIITNYNNIQYNYSCFIDETKAGKLMLLSEAPTKEKNGTEIIIPVQPKNFSEFASCTEQACRHWDVKPNIKGGTIVWQEINKLFVGNKWAIATSSDWQKNAKAIIDGIEYPIDLNALRKYSDVNILDVAKGHLMMYFGIGELSLSASREQIYLDEKTQNTIKCRLEDVVNEIKTSVNDKIAALDNLWDANVFIQKELKSVFNSLQFLGKLSWQGHQLSDGHLRIGCPIYTFSRGRYSRKIGTDPNKLTRCINTHITFSDLSELYINDLDLKDPTPRHVKKAFEENIKLNSLQVICPNDKLSLDDLNKFYHLDLMKPKLLSSITKVSTRKRTQAKARLIIFKYDKRDGGTFKQVSYSSLEEDKNNKVLCKLSKTSYQNIRQVVLKNKQNLNLNSVQMLQEKFPTYSFYGVDDTVDPKRLDEEFSDFDDIEDFIKDNILDNKKNDYIQIKFATSQKYNLDDKLLRAYSKMVNLIKDKKSLYLMRLELHNKIKAISKCDLGLLAIYESINGTIDESVVLQFVKDNPELDVNAVNDKYHKTYPLLQHISAYDYNMVAKDVAGYINLIDKG